MKFKFEKALTPAHIFRALTGHKWSHNPQQRLLAYCASGMLRAFHAKSLLSPTFADTDFPAEESSANSMISRAFTYIDLYINEPDLNNRLYLLGRLDRGLRIFFHRHGPQYTGLFFDKLVTSLETVDAFVQQPLVSMGLMLALQTKDPPLGNFFNATLDYVLTNARPPLSSLPARNVLRVMQDLRAFIAIHPDFINARYVETCCNFLSTPKPGFQNSHGTSPHKIAKRLKIQAARDNVTRLHEEAAYQLEMIINFYGEGTISSRIEDIFSLNSLGLLKLLATDAESNGHPGYIAETALNTIRAFAMDHDGQHPLRDDFDLPQAKPLQRDL